MIEPPPVAKPTGPLTREDVLAVIGDTAITVEQLEPQAVDDSAAPVPVSAIASWVILILQSPERGPAIVFSVMTLVSAQEARTVFDEVRTRAGPPRRHGWPGGRQRLVNVKDNDRGFRHESGLAYFASSFTRTAYRPRSSISAALGSSTSGRSFTPI